jgi:hypothetical protein
VKFQAVLPVVYAQDSLKIPKGYQAVQFPSFSHSISSIPQGKGPLRSWVYNLGMIFGGFLKLLALFQMKVVEWGIMQTKAAELSGILEGKTVFYVNIETPNGQGSIDETTLERQGGIAFRVEGSRIAFTAGETAAAFELLETAQILTNRAGDMGVIVTLAGNGGLQIKCRG